MARIPRGKHKHVNLQVLWEHHKEIARRLLLGERQFEICKAINVSPSWLSIITTSPAFIKYLDSLRARTEIGIVDVRKEITAGAKDSIVVLRNLLKSTNEQIQAKVAMDLLDRDGYAPAKVVAVSSTTVHLDGNRIQELKEQRQKMLEQSRMVQIN